MPMYTFENMKTGEVFEEQMKIADKEAYLEKNKHIQQIHLEAPGLGDPYRLGIRRTDNGFNDRLKEIQKKHPLGKLNIR